jgi:hypothetical protein
VRVSKEDAEHYQTVVTTAAAKAARPETAAPADGPGEGPGALLGGDHS